MPEGGRQANPIGAKNQGPPSAVAAKKFFENYFSFIKLICGKGYEIISETLTGKAERRSTADVCIQLRADPTPIM